MLEAAGAIEFERDASLRDQAGKVRDPIDAGEPNEAVMVRRGDIEKLLAGNRSTRRKGGRPRQSSSASKRR